MKVSSYLSPKTVVKPSRIAGRGLYAKAPLGRGEIVSVKGGHLIDAATRERNKAIINDADIQIVFVTLRDVVSSEELTIDYGTIDHDAEPMTCCCGAATCRGMITGEDWRRPDLQQKYGDHFAWHLLRRMRTEQ